MSDGFTLRLRFHAERHRATLDAINAISHRQFRRATMISWATKALRQRIPDSTDVPEHVPESEGVGVKLLLAQRDAPDLIRYLLTLQPIFRAPMAVGLIVEGHHGLNVVHADPHEKPRSPPPSTPPPTLPAAPPASTMPAPAAPQPPRDAEHHELDVVADFEKGSRPMMGLLGDWED